MDFHPVEENLRESFRILAGARERADVCEDGGVSIHSLGATFQMFNAAFLNSYVEGESDLERRIALAAMHFAKRKIAWAFWMCDSFLDRRVQRKAERIFLRMGLTLSSELPAMAATSLVLPWRRLPRIEIVPVSDMASRRAFCEIGAVCFHVPLLWFEEVFDERMCERKEFVAWLAYSNGEPVATAATVVAADAVGVYNVGTLPDHRGQGIGEAIVRFAIERASGQCCSRRHSALISIARWGIRRSGRCWCLLRSFQLTVNSWFVCEIIFGSDYESSFFVSLRPGALRRGSSCAAGASSWRRRSCGRSGGVAGRVGPAGEEHGWAQRESFVGRCPGVS
jgi:GNAT superfamily N-acetyltransferase